MSKGEIIARQPKSCHTHQLLPTEYRQKYTFPRNWDISIMHATAIVVNLMTLMNILMIAYNDDMKMVFVKCHVG